MSLKSDMKKFFWRFSVALLLLVGAFVAWFYFRYGNSGRGKPFPSVASAPLYGDSIVEVVATLPEPPGNLAVSATGRLFFTYHAESRPNIKVLEWVNGQPVPYPNQAFQQDQGNGQPYFGDIFNLRIDQQNRLWTLDHGFHGLKTPRLLAFDLATNQLVHQFDFPAEVAGAGSYVQDMQVSPDGEKIYIADIGVMAQRPGIIIYDLATKTARRVLDRHASVMEEPYLINAKGKQMVLLGGLFWMHPALDPIALDKAGDWLYFGPMSGGTLYRAHTRDLNNPDLSPGELAAKVEKFGSKPLCDGLTMDSVGNVYITGIEDGSIYRLGADRQLSTYVKDERFRWPDGLSFGPNQWIYLADSDIPDVMLKSKDHIKASAPFYIFRFRADKAGVPGQ
jgi:sugar lactone lactonase YvrE